RRSPGRATYAALRQSIPRRPPPAGAGARREHAQFALARLRSGRLRPAGPDRRALVQRLVAALRLLSAAHRRGTDADRSGNRARAALTCRQPRWLPRARLVADRRRVRRLHADRPPRRAGGLGQGWRGSALARVVVERCLARLVARWWPDRAGGAT